MTGVVEGVVDAAVFTRLCDHVGIAIDEIHVKNGKRGVRDNIRGYAAAARFSPWIVIVDLDHDFECAGELVAVWRQDCNDPVCLRVAVREIEAWLLADRVALARFMGVSVDVIPLAPDQLNDPKQTVVNIARRSRFREIRADMVPRVGSGRSEGPAYASRMQQFAREKWRINIAVENSDSLRRTVERMLELQQSHDE